MATDGAAAVTAVRSYHNYSLHAIVAAYGLALVPHGYYTYRMTRVAPKGKTSNLIPRTNLSSLQNHIPEHDWSLLARARGAHLNALETAPLFAAAMLAGTQAGLEPGEMNAVAGQYLVARTVYTALYLGLRSEGLGFVRTGVWAWSVGVPVWVLVRAGGRLNSSS